MVRGGGAHLSLDLEPLPLPLPLCRLRHMQVTAMCLASAALFAATPVADTG